MEGSGAIEAEAVLVTKARKAPLSPALKKRETARLPFLSKFSDPGLDRTFLEFSVSVSITSEKVGRPNLTNSNVTSEVAVARPPGVSTLNSWSNVKLALAKSVPEARAMNLTFWNASARAKFPLRLLGSANAVALPRCVGVLVVEAIPWAWGTVPSIIVGTKTIPGAEAVSEPRNCCPFVLESLRSNRENALLDVLTPRADYLAGKKLRLELVPNLVR